MARPKEQAIYTSSGRRVKFHPDEDDEDPYYDNSCNHSHNSDDINTINNLDSLNTSLVSSEDPPGRKSSNSTTPGQKSTLGRRKGTPPRPVTPRSNTPKQSKAQRSWSPLRRSRRQRLQPPALQNEEAGSVQDSVTTSSVAIPSVEDASLASGSTSRASASTVGTTSRRWFGRSKSPQKRRGRSALPTVTESRQTPNNNNNNSHHSATSHTNNQQARPPDAASDEYEIRQETQKLVRTLCAGSEPRPLSTDTVQQAYLRAVDWQEELRNLRQQQSQQTKQVENDQEAHYRIGQLQRELRAAQKAAAQLATENLNYEASQKEWQQQLEAAQARVQELEQQLADTEAAQDAQADEVQSLREQLVATQRLVEDLQNETKELKRARAKAQALEDLSARLAKGDDDDDNDEGSPNLNESFEVQLNLQKDLAKVTARVHSLELENAHYLERQRQMDDLQAKLVTLEQEKQAWQAEQLKLQTELEVERRTGARQANDKSDEASSVSHKDLMLSSSQLATATTIIGRLTEECKVLTQRENELREKLKRVETKNKNQKEIFQTALEIKQVELKIYEQEAKVNARKVEELNQTIDELHQQQASIVPASPLPPSEDPEAVAALRDQLHQTEDRLRDAEHNNQTLEDAVEQMRQELAERQERVAELEAQLESEAAAARQAMEHQAAELSKKVLELSTVIQGKEDELHRVQEELEDERKESEYRTQVRVNELTEQLNHYEVSLEEREQRIHELQSKVTEQEETIVAAQAAEAERIKALERQAEQEDLSKREAIRRKMGNYEHLLRSQMHRMQEIEHHNTTTATQNETQDSVDVETSPTEVSTSREESPPPMMVFATPVPDTRVVEMEASLKASDERIEELRRQLAEAQERMASVQQATENENGERYQELASSLKCSEDRINELKAQVDQAHNRLAQAQEAHEAERSQLLAQVEQLCRERDVRQTRLEETQGSLEKNQSEVEQLRARMTEMEAELEELQTQERNLSRRESTDSSVKDLAAINALEVELEEIRQRYDDECDKSRSLALKMETLEKGRNKAVKKLQKAEFELLASQKNMEELMEELDNSRAAFFEIQQQKTKNNSGNADSRVAALEAELQEAKERLAEADIKIDMLEQFIEAETASNTNLVASNVNHTSSMQVEADIKRKDEEMKILRADAEFTRKELLRSKERIENLEMERNYSTAKLKELSGIVKTKAGSEAEVQLYNKCIECAELSADKDDLSNQLRSSRARVTRLEQEISATRQMVNDISQSWDSAASAGENISRLKREHGESVARAATLSIELAESQMKIDRLADKLAAAERANKAYAEELNARPGLFQTAMSMTNRGQSRSRHGSPERSGDVVDAREVRRLKQRIELLEDQNAAYEASLTAFKMTAA